MYKAKFNIHFCLSHTHIWTTSTNPYFSKQIQVLEFTICCRLAHSLFLKESFVIQRLKRTNQRCVRKRFLCKARICTSDIYILTNQGKFSNLLRTSKYRELVYSRNSFESVFFIQISNKWNYNSNPNFSNKNISIKVR